MVHTFRLLFMLILMSSCNELIDVLTKKPGSLETTIVPPAPAAFVSTWRIGDASYGDGDNTVTLPLRSGYTYDFTVDWGDGSVVQTVTAFDDADIDHTYGTPGDYAITISGKVEAWYFNNSGDKNKLISVINLGSVMTVCGANIEVLSEALDFAQL